MTRLKRNGTAESILKTKSSGANGDRGRNIIPIQLTTSRIGNGLIHTLLM